jgi:hypothetical protein
MCFLKLRSFIAWINLLLLKKKEFCTWNGWPLNILLLLIILLVFTTHLRVLASSVLRFRDHTQGRKRVGRTPLDEWSAHRRDLYLINTQHSQQTNIHALGGIWTRNPSRRTAVEPRLRRLGHWDWHLYVCMYVYIYIYLAEEEVHYTGNHELYTQN